MSSYLNKKIKQEIDDFKSEIFKKYNTKLYIYYNPEIKKGNKNSLKKIWRLFVEHIEENEPSFIIYADFKKNYRKREWVNLKQCFIHIAFNELKVTKTQIAKFTNIHHSTVVYSLKKTKYYVQHNDVVFCNLYNIMIKKYKEYVGAIPKNTEVQHNT